MRIGVLALQGAVKEHMEMLRKCGVEPIEIRKPHDLDNVYGLVIPGGESTTISKLMVSSGLDKEIVRKHSLGMPIYGTCAGAILLAKTVVPNGVPSLKLMDIIAKRNDYGRQLDSFETDIDIDKIGKFHGVFIRAPTLEITNGVRVLSAFNGKPIMVEEDGLLVTTFHPELTHDSRVHKYFIDMIRKRVE